MYRIRLSLPKGQEARYRNLDILHDALVNAWTAAGAEPQMVTGQNARPWHFAALGGHRDGHNWAHALVVGSPDSSLARHLTHFDPAQVAYTRARTVESVDFKQSLVIPDPDPVMPGQHAIGIVLLSPLAISRTPRNGSGPRWHSTLDDLDLAEAINKRLSRFAERPVCLSVEPDRLYVRTRSRYDTLVNVKEGLNGRKAFVIGMLFPLVLSGSDDDLKFAWYAGLGEKNRNGFGAIGLAEKGIGR
jgi:CRISPR-associated endoribonuclease Cas6